MSVLQLITRRRAALGLIAGLAVTATSALPLQAVAVPAAAPPIVTAAAAAVPAPLVLGLAVPALVPAAPIVILPPPTTPAGLPTASEGLAGYVPPTSCDPVAKAGTTAFGRRLVATYPGTSFSISRTCGTSPSSEHTEGRAIDWANSVRTQVGAARVRAVIGWLSAQDRTGTWYAMTRRLGVMYLIWNNKMWSAYNPSVGWRPYLDCATRPQVAFDTTCHRDHLHISLSWDGASGRTSFWTKQVAAPDYGPCRPPDLNWAVPRTSANPVRCLRYPAVVAPAGSSTLRRALTTYSGQVLRTGSTGPAVRAVQQAVGTAVDGTYGTRTAAAVAGWQQRHGIAASGITTPASWRALLKATK